MELAGHKCIGFCEWDEYARASYISMHLISEEQRRKLSEMPLRQRQKEILKDEYLNGEWCATDIRTVDASNIPKADCWCFGAPCQDFSVGGKRRGLNGDRSSLVREIFRILEEIREEDRPEWLIYENVTGMLSSNRGFDFLSILLEMDRGGYDIEWQVFKSSDFGVPQKRERVYTIGHLRRRGTRKILPIYGTDEQNRIRQVGHLDSDHRDNPSAYRVYDPKGLAPTLNTGGGVEECHISLRIKEAVKRGYTIAYPGDSINLSLPNSKTRRGRVGRKVAHTLDTSCCQGTIIGKRIRKLTPKECFRLQGWDDEYFEKARFVNSDVQLYKQAGNGVTVNVVRAIAERLTDG